MKNLDGRPRSESDYTALKLAARRIVKGCGGLEASSMVTRVGHSELARYYDPEERLFMPVDVVADLEAIAGHPTVTQTLAQMLGFKLVPLLPQEELETHLQWPTLLARLGEETACPLREIGAALAEHGTLSARAIEDYQLSTHLTNLIQVATQLKISIAHWEGAADTAATEEGSLPLRKQS